MSEKTNIAWCDSTINFWSGCTKVSEGCAHCYAETLSNRGMTNPKGEKTIGQWGKGAPRRLHESAFKLAHRLKADSWICHACGQAFDEPTKGHVMPVGNSAATTCQGTVFHRRRIFSLSLGDWLDDEVPIEWLARMLDTIRLCNNVTWILCTKRPENFESRMSEAWEYLHKYMESVDPSKWVSKWMDGSSPSNIILLTSVENQDAAEARIPELLKIPAVCRGLSLEPLLGPVDLTHVRPINKNAPCITDHLTGTTYWPDNDRDEGPKLDWLIIGGESGKKARPCDVDWITSLVKQGQAAGVATFVKQLGSNPIMDCSTTTSEFTVKPHSPEPIELKDRKGGDIDEWPVNLRVREFPRP